MLTRNGIKIFSDLFKCRKQLQLIPLLGRNILSSYRNCRPLTTDTALARKRKEMVTVTYVKCDGERFTVKGREGDNLLDIAVNNDVDLEGFGACEGTLSCSTCHLIFKQKDFENIPDVATDEELDMLDLAFGLQETSRLGCQVCMTKDLDGLEVQVPAGVTDARN